MENNLVFVLFLFFWILKKKSPGDENQLHSEVQLSVERSSPPLSEQAGILDAYAPRNRGIMKWREREATGH